MKLVQFLRPLFFVALGLHALVLFLPIGNESAVIEDIAIEELTPETDGNAAAASPSSTAAAGKLPVPDPNVSTAAAKPQSQATATTRPPVNPRPARRTASSTQSNSRRPSSSTAENANASNQNRRASSGNRASNNNRNQNAENNPAADASNQNADSQNNDSPSSEGSTIAVVTEQNNTESNSGANTSVTVSALLAKVTREIPGSLETFVSKLNQSLTYSADKTNDASAQQAKATWQAELESQQANVDQIESMPAADIAELTQMEYPIESSLQANRRSLRRCLSEDPRTAEIGVLFDAQGDIADEPRVLRSTGYSAIDEEIKAIVLAYDDFPSDRAANAYTFEVEVFYDSELCITAADLQ